MVDISVMKNYSDELQFVNQLLYETLVQLDAAADDLDQAEKLAYILQEQLNRRQKLLQQWLPSTTADDIIPLQQQQQLSGKFEQRITKFKLQYADKLASQKSNTSKVNLYKNLDANR